MRILHFSDLHFEFSFKQMRFRDWFNKRGVGALNLLRGRGERFKGATKKVEALGNFIEQNSIDLVICTGDFTALGLESEIAEASKNITPIIKGCDFITLPGNHDLYIEDTLKNGVFTKYFGEFMKSDLDEYCVDGLFPIVRVFDEVVVVLINSSRPNPQPWSSNGYISEIQLEALKKILEDKRVSQKSIFIATHYSVRNHLGEPDKRFHSLINADRFLKNCSSIKGGAILSGHIHKCFNLDLKYLGVDAKLFCAGSATMENREGFWLFDVKNRKIDATRGFYKSGKYSINRK